MNRRHLSSNSIASVLMLGSMLNAAYGAPREKPYASLPASVQEQIKPLKQKCLDMKEGGEYREALTACQQLVDSLEGKPQSHGELAMALNALGEVLRRQGDLTRAEPVLRRSLQIRERLLGPHHPDIAESLDNLALVAQDRGEYTQAEELFLRDLKICEKARGPNHLDVANALNNLGLLYRAQGRYAQAEPLFKRSLKILEKNLGTNHRYVAYAFGNLAGLALLQGAYSKAEPLFLRALRIMEGQIGPNHPELATCLDNVAVLHARQGRYAQAERLHRRSLEIRERALGPNHPLVGTSLNNLARLYLEEGRYDQAAPLFRRDLEIAEKALGPNHPDVARGLSNLAGLYKDQGEYEQAEQYFRRSLEILEKKHGPEHPEVVISLSSLADIYRARGEFDRAEQYYRRSLDIGEKVLGPNHPDVAQSLYRMATLNVTRGRMDLALPQRMRGLRIYELSLRQVATESRVTSWLKRFQYDEDRFWSLPLHPDRRPETLSVSLAALLLRKGRAQDAGAWANLSMHQNLTSRVRAALFTRWESTRQQHEFLVHSGPGKLAPDEYQARLSDLQLKSEQLEYQIVEQLPMIKQLQPSLPERIVADVAGKLPADGALVELVWFKPYRFQANGKEQRWDPPRYLAMILYGDQRIEAVDLGESAPLEQSVLDFLSAVQNPQRPAVPAAQALYQRCFAPLRERLQGIRHLYLSPDRIFNLVPFAALYDGRDYLLGQFQFHYLTSGRDLLRSPVPNRPQSPLILADPDFQAALAPPPSTDGGAFAESASSGSLYLQIQGLQRLPATRTEAAALQKLLGVAPLLDARATEESVHGAQAPIILHIASHGVLLNEGSPQTGLAAVSPAIRRGTAPGSAPDALPASELDGGTASRSALLMVNSGSTTPVQPLVATPDASSLSRSAVLLAGAEHAASAADPGHDGLLTAEEVRSMNLWGTQLVVLSACETGRGALSVGQGVYGLRRSFLVAGAETLVTSLWSISDQATGELMINYYNKLVREKKTRMEAMEETMKEMKNQRPHPYYWAPFIVIGQDGLLRLSR